MVIEYFILNSKNKISNPDFYCFINPMEVKEKIDKVFTENCNWTESGAAGNIHLQAFYETDMAHLKIEILKTAKDKNYIVQMIALSGVNPLFEIARLCKINSWNAMDIKTSEYLDLENTPKLKISEKDKADYYDDYWEKFNAIQEDEELRSMEFENMNAISKKWWEFWK